MSTAIRNGETILFIGDSITDSGRMDDQWRPIGRGYVSFVRDFLTVRDPARHITVINTGIGGNTVEDLRNRWINDALSHHPDWLSVKIGINDCHRWIDNPQTNALQSPEAFEKICDQLLSLTVKTLPKVKLLLIDPFYGSLDGEGKVANSRQSRVHEALSCYIAVIDKMTQRYNARRVRTNDIFHAHLEHQHPSVYFPVEPVHPNQTGHVLIAEAVYDALSQETKP